jgi:hypothetical protein
MTAIDFEIATKREKYINTVKELRLKDFHNDQPFLMLSDNLPEGQVYQEFRDGHIELQEVFSVGSNYGFKTIRVLTSVEADIVRKDYGLF